MKNLLTLFAVALTFMLGPISAHAAAYAFPDNPEETQRMLDASHPAYVVVAGASATKESWAAYGIGLGNTPETALNQAMLDCQLRFSTSCTGPIAKKHLPACFWAGIFKPSHGFAIPLTASTEEKLRAKAQGGTLTAIDSNCR
jgi:hypothetical protein